MIEIEDEHIKFWITQGILHSEYKKDFNMTLENSKEIYALRKKITQGEKVYFIYDITKLKSRSKEARDYGAIHGLEDLAGSAIIVNSGLTQLLYNIFITLKKVDIPVKAFRIKEEAFEWLLKLKKLHE